MASFFKLILKILFIFLLEFFCADFAIEGKIPQANFLLYTISLIAVFYVLKDFYINMKFKNDLEDRDRIISDLKTILRAKNDVNL